MSFAIGAAVTATVTDPWAGLAAWSTAISAFVTAITAVLIWLQIRQTRRSVAATEDALVAARGQAEAAQSSIVEGQKALISAQMARLSVRVTGQPTNVWLLQHTDGPETSRSELKPNEMSWNMPGDARVRLAVEYQIEIANDGPGRADVMVGFEDDWGKQYLPRLLAVNDAPRYTVLRVETLEEWVRLFHRYDPQGPIDNGPSDREVFRLSYSYNADFGANEGHPVVAGGSILARVPGNDSGWTIRDFFGDHYARPDAVPQPFTRHYYKSKLRNEELV